MTLKEKFEKIFIEDFSSDWEKECENIVDNFSIGFVKFVNETDSYHHAEDAFHFNDKWHTYEEFLEIYKKNL